MNAQQRWKQEYLDWKMDSDGGWELTAEVDRKAMKRCRREAALERALEAERHKVERLQVEVQTLNEYLNSDSLEKARLRIIIHNAGLNL